MEIIQINTFDKTGGAAKVCYRIKSFLDSKNINNWLLVSSKYIDENNIIETKISLIQRIFNRLIRTEGFGKNTYLALNKLPFWKKSNLIHFHNLHGGYFNIFSILKISKNKKCIWTLHDPWIIKNKRNLVPEYLNIFKNKNNIFNILKKGIINKSNVIFVTPSIWLKNKITQEYPSKKIEVINNGIDTKIFSPTDKTIARKELNLPINKKIILFVANGGRENTEKGTQYWDLLQEKYKDVIFIEIGGNKKYINSEKELALYYSAVDMLLFPSLAENFPLSILESMSCGTPVVAFNTGGIPEIIDHKINGYLAEYKNVEDLITGINFIIEQDSDKISNNAREKIVENFDINIMLKRYIDLYKEIIG